MSERRKSSPRFSRSTDEKGSASASIQLTDDDIAVLLHVFRHRLIDSEDIYRLFPNRSEQVISRRLKRMFQAHYLGRPPRQIELFVLGGGSKHLVYGLDKEGARFLNEEFGVTVPLYHWVQKNEAITRVNIAHTLSTTGFMVDMEISARASGKVWVVPFDELLAKAPAATRRLKIPDQWQTEIDWNGHDGLEGTKPDRTFGLEYAERPKERARSFFHLEIDEGNETIEPGDGQRQSSAFFRRSSVLRKFIVYGFSHKNRTHERHFGFDAPPRVLVVTTTTERIKSMQKAYATHLAPRPLSLSPGIFLFADKATAAAHKGDLLSMPWRNAIGKEVFIDGRS